MTTVNKSVYAAAHFALELDDKQEVSLFRSVEGGGVKADVMTYHPAINNVEAYKRWKLVGKPKFEDIKLQVGMSMSQPFYNWMKEFFAGRASRKNGAIIAADYNFKARAKRTFTDAMIKELTFPKLDGADKNPVYMGITLSVEEITFERGDGNKIPVQAKNFDRAQKRWSANNFAFHLEGFDDECRRVTKIDSFTIKQNVLEYNAGNTKKTIKVPSPVEYPNITFYVPEPDSHKFVEHMQKRVGFGKDMGNGEVRNPTTLNGHIQTYDNERRPLFTLNFGGADIVSVTPDKSDATSEEVKLVKIELYTEWMEMFYPVMELE